MDYKATLMVLVLVSSALAGCTGDPDGGGGDEIDSDALQDLFDEHFQDFLNNTTITVNNHYHNNTTVVNNDYDTNNDYNNTTNVDGGEINNYNQYNGSGAGSASIMQMFTVNWEHTDDIQIIDYGSRIVTLNDTLQQTSGEPNLLYALVYNGNLIEFRDVNCEQFYSYAWLDDNEWYDYLEDNYGWNSQEIGSAGHQLENFWKNNAYSSSSSNPVNANGENVRQQCAFEDYGDYHYPTVFQIQLSVGQTLKFMSLPHLDDITLECDDGFSGSSSNGSVGGYLGGQADCTVSGIARVNSYHHYDWGSVGTNSGSNNNSSSAGADLSNIPDWWMWSGWYFYENSHYNDYDPETDSGTPLEFAVYFTTYFVEVYDLDTE
jgi:hypothetical protein